MTTQAAYDIDHAARADREDAVRQAARREGRPMVLTSGGVIMPLAEFRPGGSRTKPAHFIEFAAWPPGWVPNEKLGRLWRDGSCGF